MDRRHLRHAPAAAAPAAARRLRRAHRGGRPDHPRRRLRDRRDARALEALGPPVAGVHGNVDDRRLRRRLPATAHRRGGGRADRHGPRRRAGGRAAGAPARALPRTPTRSSSATRTCPLHERAATAFRSSIPAARPTGAARRATRWAWPASTARRLDVRARTLAQHTGAMDLDVSSSAPPARPSARRGQQ